jgi:hypothetical protein
MSCRGAARDGSPAQGAGKYATGVGVLKGRGDRIRRPLRDGFVILRAEPGTLSLATFPRSLRDRFRSARLQRRNAGARPNVGIAAIHSFATYLP